MFFVLSKTIGFLLLPSNFLLLLGLFGSALLWTRWRRLGRSCVAISLIVFLIAGFVPLGRFASNILENRFPRWNPQQGPPNGIIVLGGAINPVVSRSRGDIAIGDAAERVLVIPRLAREYPNARIVFTSGDASLRANLPAEADYLGPVLDAMGVPRDRVLLERRSRNTAENALFSKELVKPKAGERWLLVTSAQHMPRAIGCFRRVGFDVEAYPVDWTTPRRQPLALETSFGIGLQHLDDAVHEWEGLLAYWLSGKIDALFPAP